MTQPPSPPFIPARDFTKGGNLPLHRIVIHGTVSGTYCGGALAIARYFQRPSYPSSAHYVVDPCETYQCVHDWDIAWHAPPNAHSIGVELCDPQRGSDSRWDDTEHEAMLDRAASLVRQLCLAYDVPMTWLMSDDLRAGRHGITDHENVSLTWRQTTHVDPRWSSARSADFMRRVNDPKEDDDMPTADEIARAVWTYNIPSGHPENPEWWAQTFLINNEADIDVTQTLVRQVLSTAESIAAKQGVPVPVQLDEAKLAAALLSKLSPEAIANAIEADLVPAVADELSRRMAE